MRRESPLLSLVPEPAPSSPGAPPASAPGFEHDSTAIRLSASLEVLVEQADPVMALLFRELRAPQASVMLLDTDARLLHAVGPLAQLPQGRQGARQSPSACAVALLSPEGDVAAQLDWVSPTRDAPSNGVQWVSACARMIENRWLCAQHRRAMRIHFHRFARSLGGLAEGIIAVSDDERIVGANRSALELLGMGRAALRRQSLKSIFGVPSETLLEHFRAPGAVPLSLVLPDGRSVQALAKCDWPVWSVIADAVQRQTAARPVRQASQWSEEAPGWAAWLTGDPRLERIIEQLRRLSGQALALLIEGESGCGKSWLARAIHAESPRAHHPFVAVSCALRPVELLEVELFGYPLGAPGSASPGQGATALPGKLVQADGGTLFLDDIDALPPVLQARLAAFVRSRQWQSSPWSVPAPLDVAVVAASTRRLAARPVGADESLDAQAGHGLRPDLYHALNGWTVRLPALRERADFVPLVRRLLDTSLHAQHLSLSEDVARRMQSYPWPGNVAQLVQVLRAAALQAGTLRWIRPEHLAPTFWGELCAATDAYAAGAATDTAETVSSCASDAAPRDLEAIERAAILEAVEQADGNVSLAARRLGVSRNTVYRRLRSLDTI